MIRENPIHGYGFSSFYSDLTQNFFSSGYIAPHAHNTWINSTFETGLVGAGLLSLFMVVSLWYNNSTSHPTFASFVMIFAMLCGLTGLVFGVKVSTLWIITAILVAQEVANKVSGDHESNPVAMNARDMKILNKHRSSSYRRWI